MLSVVMLCVVAPFYKSVNFEYEMFYIKFAPLEHFKLTPIFASMVNFGIFISDD